MGPFTDDDLLRFARDGYVVLRDVIPEKLLAAADAEVDHLVADVPPRQDGAGHDATYWFLPPTELPRCHDLFDRSPARVAAEALVAPLPIDPAFDHVQVALTIPPWDHVPGGPHLDGYGAEPDRIFSFTMLAGIALTDQRGTASGNLWVWPGSHLAHAQLFAERGTRALEPTFGHSTLLSPPLDLGAPVELHLARGDVLLSHYLLGHNKGGNTTATVRRSIYFRLQAGGHEDRWEDTFLDPWAEYAPVRAALAADG